MAYILPMATGKELKELAQRRLKTARILIDRDEWDMAAYILGYALECGLKSVICKTLHLDKYPEEKHDKHGHFVTHKFDVLQRLAGVEYLFIATNAPGFSPWSTFTQEYGGDWTSVRYEINTKNTKQKVELLYTCLDGKNKGKDGIFQILSKKRKW